MLIKLLETQIEENILKGLEIILQLLKILAIFSSKTEKFQISQYIIKLFDYLDSSIIVKIIKYLHESVNPLILNSCLIIIAHYAPGPKLIFLPQDSIFHSQNMLHKYFLVQNNILEVILSIINKYISNSNLQFNAIFALGNYLFFLKIYKV